MTLDENQLLSEALTRLSTVGDSLNVGFDEVQQWPSSLLNTLEQARLLVKDVQAQSLQCTGCEYGCFMPVAFTEDTLRAFIVCDHPEQQEQMGRIAVSLARLNQWQLNIKQVAAVITKLLGFNAKPQYQNETASYTLGMLNSKKGRRAAVLAINPLSVVINQRSILVSELLYVEDSQLVIDTLRINDALNANPLSKSKVYTANSDKQQTRKLATQAMYGDWQDQYKKLKRENPKQSDSWISKQISKMAMGKGKDSETIRRNMKN
ncbi:hypothetical protein TUM19329_02610 [Legionella antarctica]|uniref:Uncharacterized protein n=1 Tax=Legionella antarctica TaxID=2708020 RepID=A0A6F8T167_9GAMM|nr:hypothetical protein [Legionella antarctica]BCA93900.1 hypothetical protein TUM19329_02610 [Legionella antarctica]